MRLPNRVDHCGVFGRSGARTWWMALVVSLALALAGPVTADDDYEEQWLPSLITDTPEEGFELAIKLSQRGVVSTQPDASVRVEGRKKYAEDPERLMHASQVIAIHFQTVAEANNYWRD